MQGAYQHATNLGYQGKLGSQLFALRVCGMWQEIPDQIYGHNLPGIVSRLHCAGSICHCEDLQCSIFSSSISSYAPAPQKRKHYNALFLIHHKLHGQALVLTSTRVETCSSTSVKNTPKWLCHALPSAAAVLSGAARLSDAYSANPSSCTHSLSPHCRRHPIHRLPHSCPQTDHIRTSRPSGYTEYTEMQMTSTLDTLVNEKYSFLASSSIFVKLQGLFSSNTLSFFLLNIRMNRWCSEYANLQ